MLNVLGEAVTWNSQNILYKTFSLCYSNALTVLFLAHFHFCLCFHSRHETKQSKIWRMACDLLFRVISPLPVLVLRRPAQADAALVGPGLCRQRPPLLARVIRELDALSKRGLGNHDPSSNFIEWKCPFKFY